MKPMLAHKFRADKLTYPCFVQPKLNGVRAMWIPGEGLQSRDEKFWLPSVLPHIHNELSDIPVVLDGELYIHGLSLQQINSRAAVKRVTPHKEYYRVEYHVFDMVADEGFGGRFEALCYWARQFQGSVRLVQTVFAEDKVKADMAYRIFKNNNYEGMMYREMGVPYGRVEECGNKENRWHRLMKRKEWLDMVCTVMDKQEGLGKFQNTLGALVLMTPDGKVFQAGSGLTDQARDHLWTTDVEGMKVRVKYEMLSDGGVPLKPTIEEYDVTL